MIRGPPVGFFSVKSFSRNFKIYPSLIIILKFREIEFTSFVFFNFSKILISRKKIKVLAASEVPGQDDENSEPIFSMTWIQNVFADCCITTRYVLE